MRRGQWLCTCRYPRTVPENREEGRRLNARPSPDALLDAKSVAEWLGVPESWVRESTRSGAMPCVELGRYRRYRPEDIEKWLQACSKPGRPIQFRR
jgi:excisionase family DNA binding protein